MSRVDSTAGYVLHSRPYRETSAIVDLLTLEAGKVSVVARGARRPKSQWRMVMQPFQTLQLGFGGRSELKNLTFAESVEVGLPLGGNSLICGLYVNELLQRLLLPESPCPQLFLYYRYILNELRSSVDIEGALRTFEHRLLEELGAFPSLNECEPQLQYRVSPQGGIQPVGGQMRGQTLFSGSVLTAIAEDNYHDLSVRRDAKRLMRQLIAAQLGDRPLNSRALFKRWSLDSDEDKTSATGR